MLCFVLLRHEPTNARGMDDRSRDFACLLVQLLPPAAAKAAPRVLRRSACTRSKHLLFQLPDDVFQKMPFFTYLYICYYFQY